MTDTLPKEAKLDECGISNYDSSSGDGTHWVVWFKKGKDKFYLDFYGVQHASELIAYLKSPIFYNNERVQQNGVIHISSHLICFRWEITFKL